MFWNHRVIERKIGEITELYVVEVYYQEPDNDGEYPTIIGWTQEETVYGEDIEQIRNTLNWMIEALEKPVLKEEQLLREAEERGPLFDDEEVETFDSIEELLAALEDEDPGITERVATLDEYSDERRELDWKPGEMGPIS